MENIGHDYRHNDDEIKIELVSKVVCFYHCVLDTESACRSWLDQESIQIDPKLFGWDDKQIPA